MKKHGILLEVVHFLNDLDLTISKAYISSYGGWLMDGKFTPLYFIIEHYPSYYNYMWVLHGAQPIV